jgi:hypothetical protein
MPERRASPRQARSLEGRIGYAGKYRLRCLILNMSPDGAKLALKSPANLPAEFFLSISRKGDQCHYWARTKWRRGTMLGVAFAAMPSEMAPSYGLRRGRGTYKA